MNVPALLIALAYVACELAFNARLLDLMAGSPSQCQLDGIEIAGRTLTGVGLGIVAWKCSRRWHGYRITVLLAIAAASIPLAFWAQTWLVDHLVEQSSGVERRVAKQLLLLSQGVNQSQAGISGFEVLFSHTHDPAGKAFRALLPAFGMSSSALLQGIEESLASLAQRVVQAGAGTAVDGYRDIYVAMKNNVFRQYEQTYAPASKRMEIVARTADSATAARAHQEYQRRLSGALGTPPPPPGLTKAEFIVHPTVQRKFGDELKRAQPIDPACKITLGWDLPTYTRCAYDYAVRTKAAGIEQSLRREPAAYSDGGDLQQEGRAAYRAVVVPTLALCFSLLFGLLNIVTLLFEVVAVPLRKFGSELAASLISWGAVLALLMGPMLLSNPITQAPEYERLRNSAREASDGRALVVTATLDWALRVEPVAYPVMSEIRSTLLGGWGFASPTCR